MQSCLDTLESHKIAKSDATPLINMIIRQKASDTPVLKASLPDSGTTKTTVSLDIVRRNR